MLLDELQIMFYVSSTQTVANLHWKIEDFKFIEGQNWDYNISEFMSLIDKIVGSDQNINNQDK